MSGTRTVACGPREAASRVARAEEFLVAASKHVPPEGDEPNAAVALFVPAGIAASDAICCARLARRPRGGSHGEAVGLLREAAGAPIAAALDELIRIKPRAQYGAEPISGAQQRRAQRRAEALVAAARTTVVG